MTELEDQVVRAALSFSRKQDKKRLKKLLEVCALVVQERKDSRGYRPWSSIPEGSGFS